MHQGLKLIALVAFVFAACSSVHTTSINPAADFLLASAAADFHAHRPSDPGRFRDVRLGHVMTPGGGRQYVLCGQFLAAQAEGEAKWTPFVTIKTSGYEQWIGRPADDHCKDRSLVWDEGDLSSSLQGRVASLR